MILDHDKECPHCGTEYEIADLLWTERLKDLTATLEVKLDNFIQDREMRA